MKSLVLTAQDARDLQSAGVLTITKPVKGAPEYVEGARIVPSASTPGSFHYEREGAEDTELAPQTFTPPVQAGDAAFVREPWHYRHEFAGDDGEKVVFAADCPDGEGGHKWASPVSMPESAAVRYIHVVSVGAIHIETLTAWEITVELIDKDQAVAIDAGAVQPITTGVCRHCGQIQDLGGEYGTQEEANAAAEELCDCTTATIARRKRAQVEAAKEKVRQLFGEGAEELGFRPLAGDGAVDLLERAVELIALGPISSATFNVRGQCKAKLTVSTKGKIKVSRSEVNSCDLEAGE